MLLLFGDRPGAPHVCSALMSASWVAPDVSGAVALFLSPPFTFFLSALLAAVVAVVVVAPHLTGSLRDAIVTIDPTPLLSSLLFSCLAWLPPSLGAHCRSDKQPTPPPPPSPARPTTAGRKGHSSPPSGEAGIFSAQK